MTLETQYKVGKWNAICELCGFEFKSDELRENWKGQRVCKKDWEPRNPRDFVRGKKESDGIPWSRPDEAWEGATYVGPTSGTVDWSTRPQHNVYVDATSGAVTLALGSPSAAAVSYSRRVQVTRLDTSSNTVTLTGTGFTSTTVAAGQSVIFTTDLVSWTIFGRLG